jgi:ABC-type antimicrobial peptide transport system permease subunit
MSWQLILAIIAFVFALLVGIPLGGAMSEKRARILGALGGVVVAVLTGAGVFAYAVHINVDPLSYALGAFGAMTTGAFIGTLAANFLLSLRDRRPSGYPIEL